MLELRFGDNRVIRTMLKNGELWFVARDILEALQSKTTVTALEEMITEGLGDGFVINQPIVDALGREQIALYLSEAAVTFFVARSRTPQGKDLNRWIHSEILPSIRKNGTYTHPSAQNPLEQRINALEQRVSVLEKVAGKPKVHLSRERLDELAPLLERWYAARGGTPMFVSEIIEVLGLPIPKSNKGARLKMGKLLQWVVGQDIGDYRVVSKYSTNSHCWMYGVTPAYPQLGA